MTNEQSSLPKEADAVLEAIAKSIRLVQQRPGYGSIEITVHDDRVTQTERSEKVRFEHRSK